MKIIDGTEEYMVDSKGHVMNTTTGKYTKAWDNGRGYQKVSFLKKGKRVRQYVHRLVAEAFIPNPENKPFINHIDNNPKNNNSSNLEWCTQAENMNWAARQGRLNVPRDILKGTGNPNSKLTNIEVETIKRYLVSKLLTGVELSMLFDVSPITISDIKRGRTWSWL